MGKRQDKNALADNRFVVDDSIGWTKSPEDELSDEVMDTVWTVLEEASTNAGKPKINWAERQKLTPNQSVKRIQADHPPISP